MFSFPYSSLLEDKLEITDFYITYNNSDLDNLLKFISLMHEKGKTVTINNCLIGEFEKHSKEINELYESTKNFKVLYNEHYCKIKVPFVYDRGINSLHELYELPPNIAEIYIGGDLLFNRQALEHYKQNHNIKYRVWVNHCYSYTKYISAFIRPEDVDYFSQYIDIFNVYTTNDRQKDLTYYKIYCEDKQWYGEYKEIIFGYTGSLDGRKIFRSFGERLSKCQLKCLNGKNCTFCKNQNQLYQIVDKNVGNL